MGSVTKPSWQVRLETDGFVVIPGLVSPEDCAEFREEAMTWMEKFPHGFRRDDRSTWTNEHLPYSAKNGLFNRYSVCHEAFVWKIRTNPKIVATFAQLWDTDDLIASFDGINVSLPVNAKTGRTDIEPTAPWPHIDQNPRRAGSLELYQGIANTAPNGPEDGGLWVLKGSHTMHEEHFAARGGFRPEGDTGEKENGYNFNVEELAWFKKHGCEEVKVCAGEGDLIIWDSRLIHWNSSPIGSNIRFASYVCYCPRAFMSEENLAKKLEIFRSWKGTTHWPQMNLVPADREGYHFALPRRPDDSVDPANRFRPFVEPEQTPELLRLVGVRP